MTGRRRMCVNCGREVDADLIKRGDDLPECRSEVDGVVLSACTFDLTPDEAWQHWRKIAHDQRGEIERLRAQVAELRTVNDGNMEVSEMFRRERDAVEARLSKALAAVRIARLIVPSGFEKGDAVAAEFAQRADALLGRAGR